MFAQCRLHFHRAHLQSAHVDEQFQPAGQVDVSRAVDMAQIAGGKESVRGHGRLFADVFPHHRCRTHGDLIVGAACGHQANLNAAHRLAHRGRIERRITRIGKRHRSNLRRPVYLPDSNSHPPVKLIEQTPRKRPARRIRHLQTRRPRRADIGHHLEHRRHARPDGDLTPADPLDQHGHVQSAAQVDLASRPHRRQQAVLQPVRMTQRHRRQHAILRHKVDRFHHATRHRIHTGRGSHDNLRPAGGSRAGQEQRRTTLIPSPCTQGEG